jgi:hypothetical protein
MKSALLPLLFLLGCSQGARNGPGKPGGGGNGLCDTPCGPKQVCVAGKGCVSCVPGTVFCEGNTLRACGENGEPGGVAGMCDAKAGMACSMGQCVPACQAAAEQPSNVGCEFWAVDLDNEYSQFNDAAGAPWGVVLSNAGEAPAEVIVERNDALPGQPLQLFTVMQATVAPGMLEQLTLPTREVDGSKVGKSDGPGTFLSSNAYRIKSTVPLVAYQFNPLKQTFSNDASLLIPKNGLGTQYRALGWPTANPIGFPGLEGVPDHSFVTIIGVEDGTHVKVMAGGAMVPGNTTSAMNKGDIINVTLGPFDVLNLESSGIPGDLSGTVVESDRPVAVFTGGERGIAPYDVEPPTYPGYKVDDLCCTDHLEEQLFPVTSLGRGFVVTRSPIRSTGGFKEADILRVLGVAATAQVTTNLPPPFDHFTVQPGQYKELWADRDFVMESSEPVTIGQMLVSQNFCDYPKWGGDPSLTIFPPLEQHRTDYLFLVPGSWAANFVVLAVPLGGTEVPPQFFIDGAALPPDCIAAPAGTIANVAYEARRCPISEGAHRITGTVPFGVTAYGYGPVGSYAFAGGADVKKIYTPPPIM